MPIDSNRATSIFNHAIALPLDARPAFLDSACAGDVELRAHLDWVLAGYDDSHNQSPTPAGDRLPISARETVARHSDPTPPLAFDPPFRLAADTVLDHRYRLVEEIGEGGMGRVWVSDHLELPGRRVAVKFIKDGCDSKQVLERFGAERQALALMNHPNIANVLDAGETPDGHPFFVMEFVRGVSITKYCDEIHLGVHERLELFAQVCSAIQHAHQKGIVHRDIKPSNVLIELCDGRPVPKVIDFGVAKAIGQTSIDAPADDGLAGTPLYMSPEQARGDPDVDTQSDVFSLGALLYELIEGTSPFWDEDLQDVSVFEFLRIVVEEPPLKPSDKFNTSVTPRGLAAARGTDPKHLARLLQGELDSIVMKALEKDRASRYETAAELAADVRRHLADELVHAHPQTFGYRLRKFVRRNRGPVLAAVAVVFVLVAGIVGTTTGMVRANAEKIKAVEAARQEFEAKLREANQRAKAERASDRARKVLDAMTSAVTGDSLTTQKVLTEEQKKFLTEVLTYYKEFAEEESDDQRSRERTAAAAFRVGLIEYRLGRKAESERAFRTARDGYAALATEFATVREYRANLAASHGNLAYLLTGLDKRAEAEGENEKARAIFEKLATDGATKPQYRQHLAAIHHNRGLLFAGLGQHADAENEYRKALAIFEKLTTEFPHVPEYHQERATSHNNLGLILADLGKRAEAKEEYRKALAIREKLVAEFPTVPQYRYERACSHGNMALLLTDLGRRAEAEEENKEARALFEKLVAEFPTVPQYRQGLASAHNNLGVLLKDRGQGAEAEDEHRKALAIREKLVAEFPTVPQYRQELAVSYGNTALLHAGLGQRAQAEDEYRKALAIFEQLVADVPTVPEYRQERAATHTNLGALLVALGRRADAEVEYRKALAVYEKLVAEFPVAPQYRHERAATHNNLGSVLSDLGRRAEAAVEYRRALVIKEKLVTEFPTVPHRQSLATSYHNLGRLLKGLGARAEAEDEYRKALAIREKLVAEFPTVPQYRVELSHTCYNFACLCALASGTEVNKKREYADRAIVLLQKAVKAGYRGTHPKSEPDFDALRGREDFQKMLAELEANSSPPQREK